MIKSLLIILAIAGLLLLFVANIAGSVASCDDFEGDGRMALLPMPERCNVE